MYKNHTNIQSDKISYRFVYVSSTYIEGHEVSISRYLRSLGTLRGVDWQLFNDVSGKIMGPFSRVKQSKKDLDYG